MIDQVHTPPGPGEIVCVLSNCEATGLARAHRAGIAAHALLPHADEPRTAYDQRLGDELEKTGVDLVVLAGFMRILSAEFVARFSGRLLNIHPSLLPAYKGLHTHQRVIDAGEKWHGTSVHFVTAELDGGPIIAQARLQIPANTRASELSDHVQALEHILYPRVVRWFCSGRLQLDDRLVTLDGLALENGQIYESPEALRAPDTTQ